MIKSITLNWPPVIEFGEGKRGTLKDHLTSAKRVFFLVDPPIVASLEVLLSEIKKMGIETMVSSDVVPEPPFSALNRLLEPVKTFFPDVIVGIGGGSAMDLAKLISVLFPGDQKAGEIIGIDNVKGRHIKLVTLPTTSGTGSEVTPIAVLTDEEQHLKKGVVSRFLIPDIAIVDPELTYSLPPAITASTGMDAMTHCIEAFTNKYSHPMIDIIALDGIRLIAENLEKVVKDGADQQARWAMSLASLYGGFCLGPVNTAATHALAYPLGGEFKIAHGVSNSVLLPFIMTYNLPSCVEKYARMARVMGVKEKGPEKEIARQGILKIREIACNCGIPASLEELSIPADAIDSMAEAALKVTRLLDNNPRPITRDDAREIFLKAYKGEVC
jgi:alcohol dehydrogenase class IV